MVLIIFQTVYNKHYNKNVAIITNASISIMLLYYVVEPMRGALNCIVYSNCGTNTKVQERESGSA